LLWEAYLFLIQWWNICLVVVRSRIIHQKVIFDSFSFALGDSSSRYIELRLRTIWIWCWWFNNVFLYLFMQTYLFWRPVVSQYFLGDRNIIKYCWRIDELSLWSCSFCKTHFSTFLKIYSLILSRSWIFHILPVGLGSIW